MEGNYVLRIKPVTGPYVWLSVLQCPICCALIVEDFLPEHMAWHQVEGK